MSPAVAPLPPQEFRRFRAKLVLAMMVVVTAVLGLALFYSHRNLAQSAARELAQSFERELAALHSVQAVRHAALAERCRALARKPRIHAALEDNALDLLYPTAREEMLDVMAAPGNGEAFAFGARFYRFLDSRGAVIPPPASVDTGALPANEEATLSLPALPPHVETGYLVRDGGAAIDEVMAMPIHSSETGDPIAALVLGFPPFDPAASLGDGGIRAGIWTAGTLHFPGADGADRAQLAQRLASHTAGEPAAGDFAVDLTGGPHRAFFKQLNPGSLFAPAFEVVAYPLAPTLRRQSRLFSGFAAVWGALLLLALGASHLIAVRLSQPVEKLAVDSEANRSRRARAEAALEVTHEELQRSIRFSADASHQLKTPVTVLRVGLEELLAGEKLTGELREEVSSLVHQTFRLTSVIEDLLLLSRMDAGRLKLDFARVDLVPMLASALDDLSALPDEHHLAIETDLPESLAASGEQRYLALILQNLLENARKYNRPDGRIRATAAVDGEWAVVTIGNTGPGIPATAQVRIFERFHRGLAGENVPGHGLGLNLARQLAELHTGRLRLVRSGEDWTEFELRLRLAT